MKIQSIALSLCLILTACSGGSQGPAGSPGQAGVPGKSAYQIWLEQGNTGSEQDFLDSLVSGGSSSGSGDDTSGTTHNKYFANTKEFHDYLKNADSGVAYNSDFVEQDIIWPQHNGYKHYSYKNHLNTNNWVSITTYTYNEKELYLGNYGISETCIQYDFEDVPSFVSYDAYIHNREGIGANLYTPDNGAVFKGGTLAYLHQSNSANNEHDKTELIKGDATFTYNPTNPKLNLAFENYYNISFEKNSAARYDVSISGTNNTGKSQYNLPTGNFQNKDITTKFGYVSKNGVEETFGTYQEGFDDNQYGKTNTITDTFYLTGSFGGTKQ